MNLKWADKSANETAFLIERKAGTCETAGAWAQIKSMSAGTEAAADSTVTGVKNYSYRVRAKAQSAAPVATGFSGYSNCSSVNTPAISLPKTGQNICYDGVGAVIDCAGTGQDGELKKGLAWPNPRFTTTYCNASGPCAAQSADCDADASTDIVTDNLTGLVWTRDADKSAVDIEWQEALTYANTLSLAVTQTGGFLTKMSCSALSIFLPTTRLFSQGILLSMFCILLTGHQTHHQTIL